MNADECLARARDPNPNRFPLARCPPNQAHPASLPSALADTDSLAALRPGWLDPHSGLAGWLALLLAVLAGWILSRSRTVSAAVLLIPLTGQGHLQAGIETCDAGSLAD